MKLTPTQFSILADVLNGRYQARPREVRSVRILIDRGMIERPIDMAAILRLTDRGREAIGLPPVRPALRVIRGGRA